MALTYTVEQGTGAARVHNISWESNLGYLSKSHVYVFTGTDYKENNLPFVWVNDLQIQVTAPVGEFTIRRVVPRSEAINDYEDGAILREKNLDDSFAQPLMINEEISDGFLDPTTDRVGNIEDSIEELEETKVDRAGDTMTGQLKGPNAVTPQSFMPQLQIVNSIDNAIQAYSNILPYPTDPEDWGFINQPVDDTADYGGL